MPFSFTSDDLPHFLVMLALAAVLGYLAAAIVRGRVLLGAVGSIGFGLLGAWLVSDVIRPRLPFSLSGEPQMDGVMLISAGLGAFLFALLWCLFTSRLARRRR